MISFPKYIQIETNILCNAACKFCPQDQITRRPRIMEENVWSDASVYPLLKEEYILISLYVDDRKELPEDEKFNFKFNSGRIKSIENVGQKWGTFQTVNFNAASQPYYVLMTPDMEILNDAVQYVDVETYQKWLKSGLEKHQLSMNK